MSEGKSEKHINERERERARNRWTTEETRGVVKDPFESSTFIIKSSKQYCKK